MRNPRHDSASYDGAASSVVYLLTLFLSPLPRFFSSLASLIGRNTFLFIQLVSLFVFLEFNFFHEGFENANRKHTK